MMTLREFLNARRRRPASEHRQLVIELTLDDRRFTKAMSDAAYDARELERIHKHRRRIAQERVLGRAHVESVLDDMCRTYGWDPAQVWREPRYQEEMQRQRAERYARDLAAIRARAHFSYVADPKAFRGSAL